MLVINGFWKRQMKRRNRTVLLGISLKRKSAKGKHFGQNEYSGILKSHVQ